MNNYADLLGQLGLIGLEKMCKEITEERDRITDEYGILGILQYEEVATHYDDLGTVLEVITEHVESLRVRKIIRDHMKSCKS